MSRRHVRLQDIIRYFVHFYPRRVSRTVLVKLVYLADVEFYKRYARKMTGLEYQHFHYGPFNWLIPDTAEELVAKKLLTTISTTNVYGDPTIIYRPIQEKPSLDALDSYCLDVVHAVNTKFSRFTFTQLLDYVYSTPPMTGVPPGEIIDFTVLKNPIRDALAEYTKADLDNKGQELIWHLRRRLGDLTKVDYKFEEDEKKELLENAELSNSASAEYIEEV